MTVTELEILEASPDTARQKFLHAWCTACQAAANGQPIPSMCGAKRLPAERTASLPDFPENICVVCDEIARLACEKCGG